jgi:sugar/nucleoside kinase (ribokinase family)
MASDRGVSPELGADELDLSWFEGRTLHLPAYSLAREPIASAALRAASVAEKVAVDLSSWSVLRDYGPERFRGLLEQLDPHVVFANEDEARILNGPWDERWIVKHGPGGARFGGEELPARPTTVVDTTGAGDAFAAGWWVGGPELALEAAARCVAQLGSMP